MSLKIKISLEASETSHKTTVDIEDLGFTTNEWDLLAENQKQKAVQKYVMGLQEQPYWMLDNFETD